MTPLVLIPGMMCDGRLFGPQIAALGQNRTIHLASIAGHDSIAALAAEVLAHAPPRFALAGLSMGGIVAMELLAQAPERVERLALLDTNPRAELPDMQARRGPQMETVRGGGLAEVMTTQMIPNYFAADPPDPSLTDLCLTMAMGLGDQVFIRQSRALRDRSDRQEVLAGLQIPTLVLCGQNDRLCPVERHELMHRLIARSTLEIIDGAGHLPVLEKPMETTVAMARWLEA